MEIFYYDFSILTRFPFLKVMRNYDLILLIDIFLGSALSIIFKPFVKIFLYNSLLIEYEAFSLNLSLFEYLKDISFGIKLFIHQEFEYLLLHI